MKKKPKNKVGKVMTEFKQGKLRSGSKKGPKVTNPKQAIAIGLSEERTAAKESKRKALGTKRSGASMGPKAKPSNAKPPSSSKPTGGARAGYRKRIEGMDL